MDKPTPDKAESLRRRAEALLKKDPNRVGQTDIADINMLAEELAVHQAELELQNETLRETQIELQRTRDRFSKLYEDAPSGYVVVDEAGIIRQANGTWYAMLRRETNEDLRGRPFAELVLSDDAPVFRSRFRAFFRQPEEKRISVRIRRSDGSVFHARIEARPRRIEPDGKDRDESAELMMIISDISELQQACQRAERLNHVLRAIRNVNQLITQEDDPEHLIREACETLTADLSYFQAWVALLDAESRGVVAYAGCGFDDGCDEFGEALLAGNFPPCMHSALAKNETVVVMDPARECDCRMAQAYTGRSGLIRRLAFGDRVYGVLAVSVPQDGARDEEERSLFEEVAGDLAFALHKIEINAHRCELEQRNEQYSRIVANAGEAMALVDRGYKYLEVNESYANLFGRAAGDIVGRHVREVVGEAFFGDVCRRNLGRALDGTALRFETERQVPALGRRDLAVLYYPCPNDAGKVTAVAVCIRDVTERKRAEEALRRKEQLLRFAIEKLPIPVIIASAPDVAITRYNQAVIDLLAVKTDDVTEIRLEDQLTFWPSFHPDGTPCRVEELPLTQAVTDGKTTRNREIVVRQDGRERWLSVSAAPLVDESGTIVAGIVAFPEITDRVAMEQDLKESEAAFRSYVEHAPYGVFVADREGRCVEANPAACEMAGLSRRALLSMSVLELLEDASREHGEANFRQRIRDGAWKGDVTVRRTDGAVRQWRVSAIRLDDDRYLLFSEDITEQKRLEGQLQQARRMEAVGQLAGGVAHDFNNLLMGVLGYADLCRDALDDRHPARPWVEEITETTKRSANLTRQLLAFARKQTIAPQVLNLNDAVSATLKMLRRLIGEDIELVWRPASDLRAVKMDPGQVDQILANLCVNARDAIDGVGKVTIETRNADLDDAYCEQHAEAVPGDYVMLAVSDDGCGMDDATLAHVFEPFYTTKDMGAGTGLGLATVYGIVRQNEGFVSVYSEPGEGTTFRVYLPSCTEPASQVRPVKTVPERLQGNETLLLVEDEKSIRVTTRLFLTKYGYTVLAAESPAVALRLAREHPVEVDLLITDVVMPGMNGKQLAEALADDYPDMKVLYMSGYTANVIAHRGILEEDVPFLSKPVGREQLARKVRELLDPA